MSNLENFNNMYANLAQSAYNGRPKNFPPKNEKNKEQYFNFSKDVTDKDGKTTLGGKNLPNNGVVYLQPDPTLKTVEETATYMTPNINGGYTTSTYVKNSYQEGLLTNEKAGFNAYFITDTPTLNKNTKETYLAIRGSDAAGLDTLNDWVANDANFALTNSYIPQAKLANKALKEKINELNKQAPNARLNVTGHSLGTMVSAQAVAKLYQDDSKAFGKIGKVVLFDGPDITQSLKNMGLSDKEIKEIGKKVTYYVNPFDLVSMLNRTAPLDEQFGNVNVIVPVNFATTFDTPSSHDFGEFQMDSKGVPLIATKDFHPEMLKAGQSLANLIQTTLEKVKGTAAGIPAAVLVTALSGGVAGLIALGMTAAQAKVIYDQFNKEYKEIIKTAKREAKAWNKKHIPEYQNRIRSANGAQKIELRAELLQTVAQDATIQAEEYKEEVTKLLSEAKTQVQDTIIETYQSANSIARYLSYQEVSGLLTEFNISTLWDDSVEESTNKSAQSYQSQMEKFAFALMGASQTIQDVDAKGAEGFNNLMI